MPSENGVAAARLAVVRRAACPRKDPTTGKWEDVDLIQDFVLENGQNGLID